VSGMVRTIAVEIPERTSTRLDKLSRFFGQDVDKTVSDLLESLSEADRWIESLGEKYKPIPVALSNFLENITTSAVMHMKDMDPIPKIFGVQGAFWISVFEVDIDNDRFEFSYNTLPGFKFAVHRFDLNMKRGAKNLYTLTTLDPREVREEALAELKSTLKELKPSEFAKLESFSIETEESKDLFFIEINCYAHSVRDFPSIRRVSALLKRVFKKCGIKEKAWRD
jgi:hypothetical protein